MPFIRKSLLHACIFVSAHKSYTKIATMPMAISKKRVELIIILLFILLASIIWVWYGVQLKKIEQQEKTTGFN
jgi:hypothetical protein